MAGSVRLQQVAVLWLWLSLHAAAIAAAPPGQSPVPAAVDYSYRVVASYPHDTSAFTQGLLTAGGKLFESTGGYGESSVRIVHLESGRVLRRYDLPRDRFGEGLALADGLLFQLTWKAGIGFVRDAATLEPSAEFRYSGEGWGIASYDGTLVMSNGTDELRFLDPTGFDAIRTIRVRDGNGPVSGLNELETVEGDLYANVWPTDRIAVIDPANGRLRGWLDLSGVLPVVFRGPGTDVLNGIAYDAAAKRLFVTGKRWPRLFEIEVTQEQ